MFKKQKELTLNLLYIGSFHDALTVEEYTKHAFNVAYPEISFLHKRYMKACLQLFLRGEGRPSSGFYQFKVFRGKDKFFELPKMTLTRVDF